jgi:hypothetical protein
VKYSEAGKVSYGWHNKEFSLWSSMAGMVLMVLSSVVISVKAGEVSYVGVIFCDVRSGRIGLMM